ncbi:hypothetical protein NKY70_31360 [Sinorhizobium meliloti]|uniref:hypothetical protein n=1 Tax=Rhizobium meliloti TaxID=382 RepID=UPI003D65E35A
MLFNMADKYFGLHRWLWEQSDKDCEGGVGHGRLPWEKETVNIVADFDNRLPFLLFLAGRARGTKRQQRESALLTDQRCGKLHAISRAMTSQSELRAA